MSDEMLLAVLRAPFKLGDPTHICQLGPRARQAADLIEDLKTRVRELEGELKLFNEASDIKICNCPSPAYVVGNCVNCGGGCREETGDE